MLPDIHNYLHSICSTVHKTAKNLRANIIDLQYQRKCNPLNANTTKS